MTCSQSRQKLLCRFCLVCICVCASVTVVTAKCIHYCGRANCTTQCVCLHSWSLKYVRKYMCCVLVYTCGSAVFGLCIMYLRMYVHPYVGCVSSPATICFPSPPPSPPLQDPCQPAAPQCGGEQPPRIAP